MTKRNATAAVIGAGDFIGSAIAKKFAAEGFTVFAGRRNADKLAPLVADDRIRRRPIVARGLDARKEDDITGFLRAADAHAPLEVCIFNVGGNVNFPLLDTTERVFRKVWELACYAGFLTGREAARLMLPRGKGCIFFTGATASLRGGIGYAAFASAKHGLRAVAQTMARELGPKNIHVAHLIIDAGVDTAFVRERIKQRGGAEALENLAAGSADESGLGRRGVLAALPAAARRLDVRARCAALWRGVVRWQRWNFISISAAPMPIWRICVVPEIEQRTGAKFEYVPILLGGVFKLTNNRSPAEKLAGIKNRLEYEQLEMRRFIRRHGITQFTWNPFFPVNTLLIMRGAVAAQMDGVFDRYVDAVFKACGPSRKRWTIRTWSRSAATRPDWTAHGCSRARRSRRSRTAC